ncbi:MAG: DedA family protein [Candidatus Tectomicrobia bacterium]|uniref:DedA family protein n=1 Tax=Tectimicrobiota bacterium TaxID=2528274 RepID=A0A938B474_UNCTE|nr:DedA family protein [Candidatus Tectomicrobia bacterium]
MTEILDIFLHLDVHLSLIIQQYGVWTYLLLFVIIFLETGIVVTPFLPGDSLLFAAGAFAATGAFDVGLLFALLFVAAVLGDTVNYRIGEAIGPRAFHSHSRFLKQEHLERTQQFYARHGGKTIVLARFVPIIRTFAPFVAGVGQMAYGRFLLYNVGGGLLWTGLFIFGGYYFGPIVKRHFTLVILAIIILSILPVIIEFLKARRQSRATHTQQPPKKVA